MVKVMVKPNEPIKEALRRFKKLCDKEGIINRVKRCARYEKPSERKRREEIERMKSLRKAQRAAGQLPG